MEQQPTITEIAAKDVITFAEAALFTGISKSYLYKLTSAAKIPHYKPMGKLVYFSRAELQAWLLSNRVATTAEIDEKASLYCLAKK
jgi:excisionase family DNA binding protein